MRSEFKYIALGILLTLQVAGCDRQPDHPATGRAVEFLDALQYGDDERVFALHEESTPHGFYCRSEAFEEALQKARAEKTDRECARLEAAPDAELQKLGGEARLLVQIVRFACREPRGDCVDYARQVFASQLDQSPLGTKTLTDYTIQKVLGDGRRAVVYVDLSYEGEAEPTHQTLELKKYGEEWFVAEPFVGEVGKESRGE